MSILILVVPSVSYKLWKDRNGVTHPNYYETEFTGFIIMVNSMVMAIFRMPDGLSQSPLLLEFAKCFLVSFTGHGLFFTYLFNWRWWSKCTIWNKVSRFKLLKDRIYFTLTHLSDSAIPDKYHLWRSLGWAGRLIVYVSCFTAAILWFIL